MNNRGILVAVLALTVVSAVACSRPITSEPARPLTLRATGISPTDRTASSRGRIEATLQRAGASQLSVDATFTNLGPGVTYLLTVAPIELTLYSTTGERRSSLFNYTLVEDPSIPSGADPLAPGAGISKHFDVDVAQVASQSQIATVSVSSSTGLSVSSAWSAIPRTR